MLKSHSLIFSDYDTKWYESWAKQLKQTKDDDLGNFMLFSNKFWQNAVIAQSLFERGLLNKGCKGIGFGVGKERLPALFAKRSVSILATDQDFRTKRAKHWQANELATEISQLNGLGICDSELFDQNVDLASVDMTRIPTLYKEKYDFVWSNCALGHLGSIDAGLKFMVDSALCLRPGGYAIHTTELNVLNDDETVTSGDTVVFRLKDIIKLGEMLRKSGFVLSPLHLTLGSTKEDDTICMSPKFGTDCSKIQVGGHIATQVVLIIHRPVNQRLANVTSILSKISQAAINKRNLKLQRRFVERNKFINLIHKSENAPLDQDFIKPIKRRLSLMLDKPKYIYIPYRNGSTFPLFSATCRLFSTKPILLATCDPVDRSSAFKAEDWHDSLSNRPSTYLYKNVNGKWQGADYIKAGEKFAFRLLLDPKRVKKGQYSESFHIVQEGIAHLDSTKVTISITV